ncbi:Hypothetical predicted protein [Mytilus galloprovincialis]|uniref:Uncharacterized protein n=1 Tax=Mytilus galloprovincialis TaxID=29158 RepID=A0A8B6ELB0_MYTGA|nr:Hypothetical predicted protein [Mytilus galloprovincialis]
MHKFYKNTKLDFFNKQINILENPETNVKNWWKFLRNLSGQPSKASNYPPLLVNNEYVEDDNEKSNAFNLFFCKQATVDDSTASFPNTPCSDDIPVLNNIIITEEEVFDHLSLLDVTKATGLDEISGRLLKYAARELSTPLAQLFNKSIREAVYPETWKLASVYTSFQKW